MIEEQTLPFYHERHYYPVQIGQTLRNQYRIIAKLGYGAYSTVWLAWDEISSQYTTLKICVETRDAETSPIFNEVNMLRRLKKHADEFDRPGPCFTRLARDIFELDGPSGRHVCISFKTQGASLRTMQQIFPNAQLPRLLVRSLVHRLFFSVNWLHATCDVVHTGMYTCQTSFLYTRHFGSSRCPDISPMNVLSEMEDEDCLKDIEINERDIPSVPVVDANHHPLYRSTKLPLELSGVPILADFGQMLPAEKCTGDIWCMPDLYRAPEVLLKLPFGFPADMWSIGVMASKPPIEIRHWDIILTHLIL